MTEPLLAPLSSPDTERAVLTRVLRFKQPRDLSARLFASPHARRLVEIARALTTAGEEPSLDVVVARLGDDETGARDLARDIRITKPDPRTTLDGELAVLADLADRRDAHRYYLAAAGSAQLGRWDEADADAARARACVPQTRPPRTPAERAAELGVLGERMPLGLPTLDEWTRGGPMSGKLVVIAGAPGAGKTTLALQLARRYALAGHAVGIAAFDEEADGLLIRWGQAEGLVREHLEAGEPQARASLASALRALEPRLSVSDGAEDGETIEAIAGRVAANATSRPGVLVVDSVQTAATAGTAEAESERKRVDLVVAALKGAARRHGLLVVATSEVARGYYRGGSQPATSALASAKESGGVEYAAHLLLALRNVKGEHDLVDVVVAKNRGGRRSDDEDPALRLALDRARATFTERDLERGPEKRDPVEADAALLVELVRQSTVPLIGQRTLVALLRGMQKARREAAVSHALAHGWLVGGGKKSPYTVGDRAPRPRRAGASEEWGAS